MKQLGPKVTINPSFREIRKQFLGNYFETCLVKETLWCDNLVISQNKEKTKCEEKTLGRSRPRWAIPREHEPDSVAKADLLQNQKGILANTQRVSFTDTGVWDNGSRWAAQSPTSMHRRWSAVHGSSIWKTTGIRCRGLPAPAFLLPYFPSSL